MAAGTALITGASSGIGRELAKLCAAAGFDVILAARRTERLQNLAAELSTAHRVAARPLEVDLSDPEAPGRLFDQLAGTPIDLLVNNAGFGLRGPFAETDWEAERRMIEVNMSAPAHLTKLFLPPMLKRRSGRILNVASIAAFVPGPFLAMYYASKAFLVSFSHAVANEVKGSGVTVTVLCPGPTRTEFEQAAGVEGSKLFQGGVMSAEAVARIGYDAMMAGKAEVIAGGRNRWMIRGTRLAPRTMLAEMTRGMNLG
ncbi:MAG TPA: SDR family oxidoreductase [Bryobacteraceae bacterium]|nr:SDR family oxidoreductase [Bryobacteraceae bacterium]